MRKISENQSVVQLLERNFKGVVFLKKQQYPSFIEGYYEKVLFQIAYKKNKSLILTVSENGEWFLEMLAKALKPEIKKEHICTYKLKINNQEVKNLIKFVMEWELIKPEVRIDDLKNGRIYLNQATIQNFRENHFKKDKPNQISYYLNK